MNVIRLRSKREGIKMKVCFGSGVEEGLIIREKVIYNKRESVELCRRRGNSEKRAVRSVCVT